MNLNSLGPLRFKEHYFERIWGGRRLESIFGKAIPPDVPIGEDWLISDHPSAGSVVSEGPLAGTTLRQLIEQNAAAILGSRASLTVHGRFPLLLKILDSTDWLSVQVHPDDACAARLGEPDVGKTEMWHVLHADPGSELICGLDPNIRADEFVMAAHEGNLEDQLPRFTVSTGDSVFVRAGTVHAIGGGILLAEIQQNSDLTYRIHDWNRTDASGTPRELHLDKSREATHFGAQHGGKAAPIDLPDAPEGGERLLLAACQYFAAERVACASTWQRNTRGESFHILLCIEGVVRIEAGDGQIELAPGQAAMVPGCFQEFVVNGHGALLDYYVPDRELDIEIPLRAAGHSHDTLQSLLAD